MGGGQGARCGRPHRARPSVRHWWVAGRARAVVERGVSPAEWRVMAAKARGEAALVRRFQVPRELAPSESLSKSHLILCLLRVLIPDLSESLPESLSEPRAVARESHRAPAERKGDGECLGLAWDGETISHPSLQEER